MASVLLDNGSLVQKGGVLAGLLVRLGAWGVRCAVGFAALFATFAYLKYKAVLSNLSDQVAEAPIRPAFFAAHSAAIAVFAVLSAVLYGKGLPQHPSDLVAAAWMMAGLAAVTLAGLALAAGKRRRSLAPRPPRLDETAPP